MGGCTACSGIYMCVCMRVSVSVCVCSSSSSSLIDCIDQGDVRGVD